MLSSAKEVVETTASPAPSLASSNAIESSSAVGGRIVVLGAEGLMGPAIVQHLRHGSMEGTWTEVKATDVAKPVDADQTLRRQNSKRQKCW